MEKRISISDRILFQRMLRAWNVEFSWKDICSNNEKKFVQAYSKAIGCPDEFFYFPFLSCAAACMGKHAKVKVNSTWSEPAILWIVVAARKGEKKSAAASVLLDGIKKLEKREKLAQDESRESADTTESPRLYVNLFSFERLHQLMAKNGSQMLGLFDEFSLLNELISNNKGGKSLLDRKVFLSLYNGGEWVRDYINQSSVPAMHSTCLNLTGFVQPKIVVKQLINDDADGFNDRFLFVCPPERDPWWQDLVPLPADHITFEEMFVLIRRGHTDCEELVYQFCDDAVDEVIFQ